MAQKFIKIGELERQLIMAEQQAKEKKAANQERAKKANAEQTATAEAKRITEEVAKKEAARAVAAARKAVLINTLPMLRGSWAARAKEQLTKEVGVVEAVKKLQRAARVQVSGNNGEHG